MSSCELSELQDKDRTLTVGYMTGRARVVSSIQSVMIITKARDNHLIRLTRELALWLMQTPRNGRDRGLVV